MSILMDNVNFCGCIYQPLMVKRPSYLIFLVRSVGCAKSTESCKLNLRRQFQRKSLKTVEMCGFSANQIILFWHNTLNISPPLRKKDEWIIAWRQHKKKKKIHQSNLQIHHIPSSPITSWEGQRPFLATDLTVPSSSPKKTSFRWSHKDSKSPVFATLQQAHP